MGKLSTYTLQSSVVGDEGLLASKTGTKGVRVTPDQIIAKHVAETSHSGGAGAVTSVNGQTGVVTITVPTTAAEVGALPDTLFGLTQAQYNAVTGYFGTPVTYVRDPDTGVSNLTKWALMWVANTNYVTFPNDAEIGDTYRFLLHNNGSYVFDGNGSNVHLGISQSGQVLTYDYSGGSAPDYLEFVKAPNGNWEGFDQNFLDYMTGSLPWTKIDTTSANAFVKSALDPATGATGQMVVVDADGTGYELATPVKLSETQAWTKAQSGEPVVLSVSANEVAVDLSLGNNFTLSLQATTTQTLSNPTNLVAGQSGAILITQNATPSQLTTDTYWQWAGGTHPPVSTTAGAKDLLVYYVTSPSTIACSLVKGVS